MVYNINSDNDYHYCNIKTSARSGVAARYRRREQRKDTRANMKSMKKITENIVYVGVNDHSTDLFEGQYPVPHGVAYNSYVILDDKIAVMDTVDAHFAHEWLTSLSAALGERRPDYLVVHHMEPDHSANIFAFKKAYPEAAIVATDKAFRMMEQFFGTDLSVGGIKIKDGDTLSLGAHTLHFVTAPMVHWPEVAVSFEEREGILFSADAFGKFGALDIDEPWEDEARRYYIGIVGKYGKQVEALLKKAAGLDIKTICPLHGPILTSDIGYYVGLYSKWASYEPETEGAVIAYTSVYGNTASAVHSLAEKLRASGCPAVEVYDLSRCDMSAAVAAAFRYSKLILATTTYNAGIFPAMRTYVNALTERGFKKRTVGLIENGSWAPRAAKELRDMLAECPDLTFTQNTVTIMSAPDEKSRAALDALVEELCAEYIARRGIAEKKTDPASLFNIGYGLYVVTSNDGEKDNGLIVNTVSQITSSPNRVAVAINKANYSHATIKSTGIMNVNCLSVDAPFSVFEDFGFRSGRDVDKFADIEVQRSSNGLAVLPNHINSYMSLRVVKYIDLDTHGMFICEVDEARVLSERETMTYTYYQKNVKPRPEATNKKGFVCRICGYVYEGDELPADFICPLCKHGAEDFEPLA